MKALVLLCLLVGAPAAVAERAQECEEKLEAASTAGIVAGMNVTGRGVEVVVSESVWSQMPFTTKVGLVRVVSCAITAGDESKQVPVIVLSDLTNQVLGEGYPSSFEVR